jgi:hypothetical protein
LTNFPLLGNIAISPFAGGGKVMGSAQGLPRFLLYFLCCESVILIEERRELGLVTYSQAARKNKSDAGS